MSQACFTSVDACAIRVAKLATSGHALAGASNGYVSDAQIKIDIGLEIDTGAEFIQKNGCGQIVTSVKEPDKIKRATLKLDLAQLDFELMYLMCGGNLKTKTGHGIGYEPPAIDGGAPAPICFEVWSKAFDAAQQSVPAFTSPNAAYLHFVLPMVACTQQPFTLANGITVFSVNGNGSENAQISADGPFNDWPTDIAQQSGITRTYGVFLDPTIPTAACGFISVPTAS